MTQENSIPDCVYKAILDFVSFETVTILEVSFTQGQLASYLRVVDPLRTVYSVEKGPRSTFNATQTADQILVVDLQKEVPSLPEHSLDCIIFANTLEQFARPEEVLFRVRKLLKPNGYLLATIYNASHYSAISHLLQGDNSNWDGISTTSQPRFTWSSACKFFLAGGYLAHAVVAQAKPSKAAWQQTLPALAKAIDGSLERIHFSTETWQFLLRGQPLPPMDGGGQTGQLTFSVCVSDEWVLHNNLLASGDFRGHHPHEILLWRGVSSAAQGHNQALAQAKNRWVICVHQDVYLSRDWVARFWHQLQQAEAKLGRLDLVGVYGFVRHRGDCVRAGRVMDRAQLLCEETPLPGLASSLDEMLIAVRTESGLRLDPALGWHLYGTDLCLAAKQQGLKAAVIDGCCFHNSRSTGLSEAFDRSADYLAHKWADQLPIATPCKVIRKT
jgi:hypothetical protein